MIEIIIQSITLLVVIYFLWRSREKDREKDLETINDILGHMSETQDSYYNSLEKISKRDIAILEKNNKEFLKTFAAVFKKEPVVAESFKKSENTIEKESEAEEINLVDMPRIPIVDGVKIKFEDEEGSLPISIFPMQEVDTKENPIEK